MKLRIIVLVLVIIALTSCFPDTHKQFDDWTTANSNNISYRVFYIEGMPCVWVAEFPDGSGDVGVSCDWSKNTIRE